MVLMRKTLQSKTVMENDDATKALENDEISMDINSSTLVIPTMGSGNPEAKMESAYFFCFWVLVILGTMDIAHANSVNSSPRCTECPKLHPHEVLQERGSQLEL